MNPRLLPLRLIPNMNQRPPQLIQNMNLPPPQLIPSTNPLPQQPNMNLLLQPIPNTNPLQQQLIRNMSPRQLQLIPNKRPPLLRQLTLNMNLKVIPNMNLSNRKPQNMKLKLRTIDTLLSLKLRPLQLFQ